MLYHSRVSIIILTFSGAEERSKETLSLISCVPLVASGKAERFGAKKKGKKHPPNPSPSLYGRSVIDSGQEPPSIKVLVWLSSFRPKGFAMDCLSAGAYPLGDDACSKGLKKVSNSLFIHKTSKLTVYFFSEEKQKCNFLILSSFGKGTFSPTSPTSSCP